MLLVMRSAEQVEVMSIANVRDLDAPGEARSRIEVTYHDGRTERFDLHDGASFELLPNAMTRL